MRLQSLYIKGFKSFANETTLHFNEDVIGVVGPNGSGKSNIVDAIRWVLGEQKGKELRLESMTDVIFNGTKTRKEAAAAIVTMTFENSKNILPVEYNQVSVSRVLYRSGESEYRLNNIPCRLKDINSLFMDTGIGSNSYAIIVLGMVDDILADKEQARRRMFEQAAGISKYKVRKRETLNKLKSAEEDLNRVDDLLFEIEGNLKVLEKQAKRTQKYNELKAEYKNISVRYAILSIQSLKNEFKQTADTLRVDQDKYKSLDAEIYTLQAKLEQEKKKHLDKEVEVNRKQRDMGDLVNRIRNAENEKNLIRQNIDFKRQNIVLVQKQITQYTGELTQVQSELKTLQERIIERKDEEQLLQAAYKESEVRYKSAKELYGQAKSSFDSYQIEKQELDKKLFENEKQIAVLQNSIENAINENNRLSENLKHKSSEIAVVKNDAATLDQNYQSLVEDLKRMESKEEDRKRIIAELEITRDKLIARVNQVNRILDARQNEHNLLKSMIESYEGFPESVRFLSEKWRKNPVLLTDIVQVEDSYKATVEQYLEQYLNYFIVDSESDAIAAIRMLKDGQKGKANFFLLNRVSSIPDSLQHIPFAKPAIDVVQTKPPYINLLRWLLKDVFITDADLDQFQIDEAHSHYVFLSASGIFQCTGVSFSGGSVGLFEGKRIGRKQNLEHLAEEIDKQSKMKAASEQELSEVKQQIENHKKSDLVKDISKISSELSKLEQLKVKTNIEIENFEKFVTEVNVKINANLSNIANAEISVSKLLDANQILNTRINEISSKGTSTDSQLNQLYQQMNSATEQYNQDNIAMIRHQNLLSNFEKDIQFKEGRISEFENKLSGDKFRLTSEERLLIDLQDSLVALEEQLAGLYTEKENYAATLSEAEQHYFKARNVISEIEEQLRTLSRSQNLLQNQIQQLKDRYTECRFRINAVGERLKIEFEVNINDIINNEPDIEADATELELEVEKIRSRLHNFGEINPLALETYNEMSERYLTIKTQRKDILDAKVSLEDTMKEIEQTATDKFLTAFNNVRTNFIEVFRSLFTDDDTCDLILLNPENPLESEIEIIAKPKGKKPKSLSQLSGGEKTLTATALLFALYLLKPAPFCIFDEVDAPLDDANIQKFNKIIKRFSRESQFIIVTHNKSTMAEVDTLYGVFMDEPGVSAVSAVDFRSFKHQPILESINSI